MFVEKMKASKYPWAAINITKADGSPIEGLGGVMMKEVAGVKVALIPVAQDTSPQVASTGDLKFGPTVDSRHRSRQAGARRTGPTGDRRGAGTAFGRPEDVSRSKAFDVILSGDDHDSGGAIQRHHGLCRNLDRGQLTWCPST